MRLDPMGRVLRANTAPLVPHEDTNRGAVVSGPSVRPPEMATQEVKGAHTVDRVRPIEEFDFRSVPDTQPDVAQPGLRVLVGDPFIGRDAVAVAPLDHEWPWADQPAHLGVVERVPE